MMGDQIGELQTSGKQSLKLTHLVVVASGGQVLVVRRPFEAAHFLPVSLQPSLCGGRGSDVPLEDHTIPAAR